MFRTPGCAVSSGLAMGGRAANVSCACLPRPALPFPRRAPGAHVVLVVTHIDGTESGDVDVQCARVRSVVKATVARMRRALMLRLAELRGLGREDDVAALQRQGLPRVHADGDSQRVSSVIG